MDANNDNHKEYEYMLFVMKIKVAVISIASTLFVCAVIYFRLQ